MSPAGKGSPGKGGKAPAGKASGKGGKGGARGSSVPRKAAQRRLLFQGSLFERAGGAQSGPGPPDEAE
jgi:hypothetical protein